MKLKSEKLKNGTREKCLDAFFKSIKHEKSKGNIERFLSDVLTESEKIMIGRRILIASRLLRGQPYESIVREMGVGQDTVYRVKKWLGGRHMGIKDIVEKIKRTPKKGRGRKSEFRDYYPTSGFSEIRRRYKTYYWISDLLDEINSD